MKNSSFLTWGLVALAIGALIFLTLLLSGSWGGGGMMAAPHWTISPMGGTMSIGVGEGLLLLAGTVFLAALAIWVVNSGKKK